MSRFAAIAFLLLPLTSLSQSCLEELARVVQHFHSDVSKDAYSTMAIASGKSVNDLGDYSLCGEVEEANYALISAYKPNVWIMASCAFVGFCGPKSCNETDYASILSRNYSDPLLDPLFNLLKVMKNTTFNLKETEPNLLIKVVFPKSSEEFINQISFGGAFALLIAVLLISMVVVGTGVDMYKMIQSQSVGNNYVQMLEVDEKRAIRENDHWSEMVLKCFSLYTNVPKLFSLKSSKDREPLDVLHALRVLFMLWIIYGHVCQFRLTVSPLKNFYEIYDKMKQWSFAFVYSAEFAVDAFFWMSGLLMAYLFLSALRAKQTMNSSEWLQIYTHRLYRILPGYAFILFLLWSGLRYLGSGPLWFQQGYLNSACEDYWWTNLSFLNNFIPGGEGNLCLTQSWYLANDMQFFLLSPPLLYSYHNHRKWLGWVMLCVIIAGSVGISLYIADSYEYNVVAIAPGNESFYFVYYTKPYCRVAPYALGMASGIIHHSAKVWDQKDSTPDVIATGVLKCIKSECVQYFLCISGLFLMSFIVFCQYSAYTEIETYWQSWSPMQSRLFLGFNHFGFALGLTLFLLPALCGFSTTIRFLLGHPIWAPVARLTFCVYLVHVHLVCAYFVSEKTAYWMDDVNLLGDAIIAVLAAYSAAMVLTLVVESPFAALEKNWRLR